MAEVKVNKKVCMVTWGHDALDDRIFYKETLSLRKAYSQVTILATGRKRTRRVEGVRVVTVGQRRFPPWTMWKMSLAARIEKAHFYHLHEPQLLPLALFLKILSGAKIVYDVHEHLPEMIKDFSTKPRTLAILLASWFSIMEQMLVRIADAVVVTSDLLASRYERINRRVVAIYNYPRVDLFASGQSSTSNLRRKYASNRVVLYHGQIGRVRGIPMLIKAIKLVARKIQGLKLLLLGPIFGNSFRDELVGLVGNEKVEELVELIEPVPHQQVPHYIALSEVGLVILPSLSVFRNSLPIKLFEYMACGVPVVASRLPSMEPIVREAQCGLLVNPMDDREIAEAMVQLLQQPEGARNMGLRGIRAVAEKYNWSRMEERLLALYSELEEDSC